MQAWFLKIVRTKIFSPHSFYISPSVINELFVSGRTTIETTNFLPDIKQLRKYPDFGGNIGLQNVSQKVTYAYPPPSLKKESPNHAELSYFTLLLCKGRLRNVQKFITLVRSRCRCNRGLLKLSIQTPSIESPW